MDFALSFDGYNFFGEGGEDGGLGDFCNHVAEAYANHPSVLKAFNTTGLRMLLFFEQRRARWTEEPTLNAFTKAIIEAIRERLAGK